MLISSPFAETIHYIFDLKPVSLLTEIILNSCFILPITFLFAQSKNFDLYSLKSNKYLYLKSSSETYFDFILLVRLSVSVNNISQHPIFFLIKL